jgi:streptomycin 6-kinase
MTNDLPPAFLRNVTGAFQGGAEWLGNLTALLSDCLRRWDLSVAGGAFDLSFHYVAPVVRADGKPAVLKLGVPTQELTSEIKALRIFDGHGAVALLESDASRGALLLERIQPGETLAGCADSLEACEIAAQVMQTLWQAAPATSHFPTHFPGLERWTLSLLRSTGQIDPDLIDLARKLRADLLRESGPQRFLHGDLHHFNILHGDVSGWVAIDPKGVIGDPCYEPATFLLNPRPEVVLDASLQASRIALLAKRLDLDRERILRWAIVQAVVSACWTREDGGEDYRESLAAARIFARLTNL